MATCKYLNILKVVANSLKFVPRIKQKQNETKRKTTKNKTKQKEKERKKRKPIKDNQGHTRCYLRAAPYEFLTKQLGIPLYLLEKPRWRSARDVPSES